MTRPHSREFQERGSLPLALLVAIIVGGLVAVLVTRTVATQNQVRFDQSFHAALPVAEAGANLGKFWLNNGTELQATGDDAACDDATYPPEDFPVGCSTPPETRELEGRPYTFVLSKLGTTHWEVSSEGLDDTAVGDESDVERLVINTIREQPLVDVALFADLGLRFGGSNTADSYTSASGVDVDQAWCTGNGFVATNSIAEFNGAAPTPCHGAGRTVDRVFLHDWENEPGENVTDDNPGGDRCVHAGGGADGANCEARSYAGPPAREYPAAKPEDAPLELANPSEVAFIQHALDACDAQADPDENLETLRTSDVDGTLVPGTFVPDQILLDEDKRFEFPGELEGPYTCVDELIFDVDTQIATSPDQPVIIVVRNEVTIEGGGTNSGTHVGCFEGGDTRCEAGPGGSASRPVAERLWIFTNGDITLGNHSAFAGVLWGPTSDCGGGAQADVYGSLICGELPMNLGSWRFHFDDSLANISSGEFYDAGYREEFIE